MNSHVKSPFLMGNLGKLGKLQLTNVPTTSREVHGESYVYYRYDGGSGISLAYSPGGRVESGCLGEKHRKTNVV